MTAWLTGLALVIGASSPAAPPAPPIETPIVIGQSHSIVSAALDETRVVTVVLPASYAKQPDKKYPVLYLIDGGIEQDLLHIAGVAHLGAIWGRSAEAIVVGIETKDRRRELVGPTQDPELLKRYPTAGSSARFRRFIREEVKPLIERRYRASGHDGVLGESLAGLFVVETYLEDPSLFDGYAAVDPSLWWDRERLSIAAASRGIAKQRDKPIYIAAAKEQTEEPRAMKRLLALLNTDSEAYCAASRPDLLHATIYQQLSPQAVQFLLSPDEPPAAEYGFVVSCTEASGASK